MSLLSSSSHKHVDNEALIFVPDRGFLLATTGLLTKHKNIHYSAYTIVHTLIHTWEEWLWPYKLFSWTFRLQESQTPLVNLYHVWKYWTKFTKSHCDTNRYVNGYQLFDDWYKFLFTKIVLFLFYFLCGGGAEGTELFTFTFWSLKRKSLLVNHYNV